MGAPALAAQAAGPSPSLLAAATNCAVQPHYCTHTSPASNRAPRPLVRPPRRLKAAGAVLVAKLVTGEMALGDRWWGGDARSPWNLAVGASGSSAGDGARDRAAGQGSGGGEGGGRQQASLLAGVPKPTSPAPLASSATSRHGLLMVVCIPLYWPCHPGWGFQGVRSSAHPRLHQYTQTQSACTPHPTPRPH